MSVALYQKGKEFVWEGLELAMKVVAEAEVEAHKLAGWVLHPYDTIEVPDTAPASTEPTPIAPAAEQAQTPTEQSAAPTAPANPFA